MNQPRSMERGIIMILVQPVAISSPSTAPRDEKPMLTPVRNSTRPIYVYKRPKQILASPSFVIFREKI